ncbi:hypothetical protein [Marispirochaeta aestuarii]|uniref:hypothetical protein n=1 Tax=Marispirochaeta aestuarii TaxID=1963862 RepID=UPI0029C7D4C5|nr:hypothetical protein [Marispirochaeta aestuarii]
MKQRPLPGLIVSGLLALLLGACSAAPPRIEGVSWEVFRILSPDSGSVREELSLFIRAEDDDGRADLEELYLLHPESRLYWRLFPETWEERTRGNTTWTGSSGFSGVEGVPRGEYLLVLLDRAGERTEERIFIDLPPFSASAVDDEYPQLVRQGPVFLIDSSESGPCYILGQDTAGRVLVSAETEQRSFDPREYTQNEAGTNLEWYVFVSDSRGWYTGSGPY